MSILRQEQDETEENYPFGNVIKGVSGSPDHNSFVTDSIGRIMHIWVPAAKAVEQTAKADPNNIQEVAASQLAIINSYYQSGLQQSQQSFRWSLIWCGIGFGFLIVAVGVLLFSKPTEVAFASGIAGTLVEIFAGTYLYLYKHASDQLAAFRTSLERTQHLLLANTMCEKLEGTSSKLLVPKLSG